MRNINTINKSFIELWTCSSRQQAKAFLDQWFWWATHSRLDPIRKFTWLLRNHQEGILAYFDFYIDNGAVEAMNNNAKSISHRAIIKYILYSYFTLSRRFKNAQMGAQIRMRSQK